MTTPDDEQDGERSEANKAYYEQFFALKDKLILMALREAEWYYENGDAREREEHRQMSEAVSDAFDDAAREFVFFSMKPIPE